MNKRAKYAEHAVIVMFAYAGQMKLTFENITQSILQTFFLLLIMLTVYLWIKKRRGAKKHGNFASKIRQ